MRHASLLASLLVAALGPILLWTAAQRARGFEGELILARPAASPAPPRARLVPGLRRESFGEQRGVLHQASRSDGTLHATFRGQIVPASTRFMWTGWIDIEQTGLHGFELKSDDGSHLRIDGRTVVHNWGTHSLNVRPGRVHLEKGLHALELDYYQSDGAAEISLHWRPPGGSTEHVPARVLFHEKLDELPGASFDLPEIAVVPDFEARSFPGLLVLDHRANLTAPQRIIAREIREPRLAEGFTDGSRLRWVIGALRARGPGPHLLAATVAAPAILQVGGSLVLGTPARPFREKATCVIEKADGWIPFQMVMDSRGVPGGSFALESTTLEIRASWDLVPPAVRSPDLGDGDHVTDRHDRTLAFPDAVSLHAGFFHRWSVARLGHPSGWPLGGGRWKGWLRSPKDDRLRLSLRSTGQVSVRVGGAGLVRGRFPHTIVASLPVRAGWNEIEVEWRDPTFWRELELRGALGDGPLVALGSENIFVRPVTELRGVMILGTILGVIFITLVWLGGGPEAQRDFVTRHRSALMIGAIGLVGLGVRLHGYENRPFPTRVEDEYNHHILGRSLLELGLPIGWDFRDHYDTIVHVPFHGRHYKIAVPLVFYPPAFSVMVATLAGVAGYDRLFDAPLHVTRLLPIALSVLTLLLLYPLARRMGVGPTATMLGMMHFATFPFFVINHRLVKEENLVAFLYAALLLVLIWAPSAPGAGRRHLAGFLILLGVMTKQTAIALPVLGFFVWWQAGHRRAAGLMLLYGILGVALFILYGFSTHAASFVETQSVLVSSGRRLDALIPLITEAKIVDRSTMSSLLVGTWILAFMTLATQRRGSPLTVAFILYLLSILFAYEPQRNYGWYRLPLFPFLSICWGIQAERLTRYADPLRVLLFVGLYLLPALDPFSPTLPGEPKTWLRIIGLAWLAPTFLSLLLPRRLDDSLRQTISWTLIAATFLSFSMLLRSWAHIDPYHWPGDPGGAETLTLDGPLTPRIAPAVGGPISLEMKVP